MAGPLENDIWKPRCSHGIVKSLGTRLWTSQRLTNKKEYMTIDKNLEGAWRICENINGYLETQVYYFYTKAEAIKKFNQFKKGLKNA